MSTFGGYDRSLDASKVWVVNEALFHSSTSYFALISGILFALVLRTRGWTAFFRGKMLNVVSPYIVMTLLFTLYGLRDNDYVGMFEGGLGDYVATVAANLWTGGASSINFGTSRSSSCCASRRPSSRGYSTSPERVGSSCSSSSRRSSCRAQSKCRGPAWSIISASTRRGMVVGESLPRRPRPLSSLLVGVVDRGRPLHVGAPLLPRRGRGGLRVDSRDTVLRAKTRDCCRRHRLVSRERGALTPVALLRLQPLPSRSFSCTCSF